MKEHWLDKWEREKDEKYDDQVSKVHPTQTRIKFDRRRLTALEKAAIKNDLLKIQGLLNAILKRLDNLE